MRRKNSAISLRRTKRSSSLRSPFGFAAFGEQSVKFVFVVHLRFFLDESRPVVFADGGHECPGLSGTSSRSRTCCIRTEVPGPFHHEGMPRTSGGLYAVSNAILRSALPARLCISCVRSFVLGEMRRWSRSPHWNELSALRRPSACSSAMACSRCSFSSISRRLPALLEPLSIGRLSIRLISSIRAFFLIDYSGDVNGLFRRDVNGHSGHVNKVGAQRRWDCNHIWGL
jgi:hypothetical protein